MNIDEVLGLVSNQGFAIPQAEPETIANIAAQQELAAPMPPEPAPSIEPSVAPLAPAAAALMAPYETGPAMNVQDPYANAAPAQPMNVQDPYQAAPQTPQTVPQEQTQQAQAPQEPQAQGEVSELDQMRAMINAEPDQAKREAMRAEFNQRVQDAAYKDYVESEGAHQENIAKAREQRRAEAQRRMAEIDSSIKVVERGIDPNNFWETRSTGQKVAGFLAMALSGMVKPETAQFVSDQINNAIARDIDAQKTNITNRRMGIQQRFNAYDRALQLFEDEEQAENAAYIASINRIQKELEHGMQKIANPTAREAAGNVLARLADEKQKRLEHAEKLQREKEMHGAEVKDKLASAGLKRAQAAKYRKEAAEIGKAAGMDPKDYDKLITANGGLVAKYLGDKPEDFRATDASIRDSYALAARASNLSNQLKAAGVMTGSGLVKDAQDRLRKTGMIHLYSDFENTMAELVKVVARAREGGYRVTDFDVEHVERGIKSGFTTDWDATIGAVKSIKGSTKRNYERFIDQNLGRLDLMGRKPKGYVDFVLPKVTDAKPENINDLATGVEENYRAAVNAGDEEGEAKFLGQLRELQRVGKWSPDTGGLTTESAKFKQFQGSESFKSPSSVRDLANQLVLRKDRDLSAYSHK